MEVLLLLRETESQQWTAATVARKLYIDPGSAARRLEDLRGRGLLSRSEGAEPEYRFAPQRSDLRQTVSDLAAAYQERRVTVTQLIFSKPSDHISVFADAFRIRGDG